MDVPLRPILLAFSISTLGCQQENMIHRPALQLVGEVVVVSYLSDPHAGHGQFRLENGTDQALRAAVLSAWLDLDGTPQPIASPSVFDRGDGRMVDPDSFAVPPQSAMTLLLGFPSLPHEPRYGDSIDVGLRLGVDGEVLEAISRIEFVRRIPRG